MVGVWCLQKHSTKLPTSGNHVCAQKWPVRCLDKKIKCKIISILCAIFVHTPRKERMTYGPHSIIRDLSLCIPVLIRVSCYAHMGLHHDHFHCDTPWLRYANYQWHFEPSAVLLSTQIVRIYDNMSLEIL